MLEYHERWIVGTAKKSEMRMRKSRLCLDGSDLERNPKRVVKENDFAGYELGELADGVGLLEPEHPRTARGRIYMMKMRS